MPWSVEPPNTKRAQRCRARFSASYARPGSGPDAHLFGCVALASDALGIVVAGHVAAADQSGERCEDGEVMSLLHLRSMLDGYAQPLLAVLSRTRHIRRGTMGVESHHPLAAPVPEFTRNLVALWGGGVGSGCLLGNLAGS